MRPRVDIAVLCFSLQGGGWIVMAPWAARVRAGEGRVKEGEAFGAWYRDSGGVACG